MSTDIENTKKIKKSFGNTPLSKIYWKDYLKAKNYNSDVNSMCEECIQAQISKYGKQEIDCKGLASADMLVDEKLKHLFSDEDMDTAEQLANPYAWANRNIHRKKFTERWYQEMFTRCTSKRLTLRCGRRAGKALAIDTPIPTPDGWRIMEDISVGDKVFDENGEAITVIDATEIMINRDCYNVVFSDGSSIVADGQHLWTVETKKIRKNNSRNKNKVFDPVTLTTEEMSKNVKVTSKDESNYSIRIAGELNFSQKEMVIDPYVLGFWLGEGCRGTSRVAIGNEDLDELTSYIIAKGYSMRITPETNDHNIYGLITDLKKLGIDKDKFIPRQYLESDKFSRLELLKALMDTDGTIDKNGKAEFTSCDMQLSQGVYELIIGLGMKASFSINDSWFNGKKYLPRYRIYFNPNKQVFKLKRKADRVCLKNSIQNNRYITEIHRVKSVPVKCIEVDSVSRLYLASRACIPTHNSYAMALKMLHRAMMTECKILVVTPYEVQAEELMNLILEFVWALNPDYGDYDSIIEKFIKSPTYFMKFKNHSRIRAFTTGASGAGSVRGQAADIIVLDEVDYMSEADFNSILAILADNPNVELWVASTPNGKSQLYRLEELQDYRSFHFPSFVLPHYNDKLDREFKGQFTDIGYVQEVMAEFGEGEASVFQDYFIEKNLLKGIDRKDVLLNRDGYIVFLGGDWNDDKNGTRLLAIAFDKVSKLFFVAEKRRVSKEGWTQVAAVQEIIEFNRKYNFDYVYLDEGYGVSNIQFIKQYAIDKRGVLPVGHPDLKLSEVVGVNFSSKVEVIPVEGGDPIKKDMKTYLVENTVRLLERDSLKFDVEYDKELLAQMNAYVILRKTPTGRPVYGCEDTKTGDHDLDAFMVGLLGWSMENSTFLNHAVTDTLVKLVSRDEMGESEQVNESIGPGLFATTMNRKTPTRLFNSKINRYNRATFNKNNTHSFLGLSRDTNVLTNTRNSKNRRSEF